MNKSIQFKDKDGRLFVLSPMGYEHIRREHCIADPVEFIKDTLLNPFAVVSLADNRIKTAFISDSVKGGKIIWLSKKLIS